MGGDSSTLRLASDGNYITGPEKYIIEFYIPHALIGLVIGKSGHNIKRIQNETGARIKIESRSMLEEGNDKNCTITGTREAIEEAFKKVSQVIEYGATKEKVEEFMSSVDSVLKVFNLRKEIIIPHAHIGFIVGKGAENIKRVQNETGALVSISSKPVDLRVNKVCVITGSRVAVKEAHRQVAKLINP